MIWLLVTILLIVLYVFLIGFYIYGWERIPELTLPQNTTPKTKVSILIIGRNEAINIPACINSIVKNDYPKHLLEIIYVDDHSEDDSIEVLKEFKLKNLQILRLQEIIRGAKVNSYKKMAIGYARSKSTGELFLHTDADSRVETNWIIRHVQSFVEDQSHFIAAPVFILAEDNLLSQFQHMDFLVNMGITGVGIWSNFHFMANGANMSYSRNAMELTGDDENLAYASGDDMFMVQAVAKQKAESVAFIKNKDTAVFTYPEASWSALFRQRLRWAGKSKAYNDHWIQAIVILIFLMNASLLVNLLLSFWNLSFLLLFLIPLAIKMTIDIIFIRQVSGYYHFPVSYRFLITSNLLYPIYFISIGLASIFITRYKWKDRAVR